MSFLRLGPQDGLYFEHHPPADSDSCTFVFFNALTGDTATWEGVICPILRSAGYGTLTYNMRGQSESPFSPEVEFTEAQIVSDAGTPKRRFSHTMYAAIIIKKRYQSAPRSGTDSVR